MQGTAVLGSDGVVEAGVLVHAMSEAIFSGNNFSASMQLSPALEGTGGLDTDGDYVLNAGIYAWAAVACSTVVIP